MRINCLLKIIIPKKNNNDYYKYRYMKRYNGVNNTLKRIEETSSGEDCFFRFFFFFTLYVFLLVSTNIDRTVILIEILKLKLLKKVEFK